jgi:hypothetical protein
MFNPNNGKVAPNTDRRTVFAAIADAAYNPNVSMRYMLFPMPEMINPVPINTVPICGTIQWTLYSAVQPYTRKPMGMRGTVHMLRTMRDSGFILPSFFAA